MDRPRLRDLVLPRVVPHGDAQFAGQQGMIEGDVVILPPAVRHHQVEGGIVLVAAVGKLAHETGECAVVPGATDGRGLGAQVPAGFSAIRGE